MSATTPCRCALHMRLPTREMYSIRTLGLTPFPPLRKRKRRACPCKEPAPPTAGLLGDRPVGGATLPHPILRRVRTCWLRLRNRPTDAPNDLPPSKVTRRSASVSRMALETASVRIQSPCRVHTRHHPDFRQILLRRRQQAANGCE